MTNSLSYKQYIHCLKDVLLKTFEDRKLVINFVCGIGFLIVGTIASLCVPFVLKKSVDSLSTTSPSLIPILLISYGLIWMISQASVHIRGLFIYKIEQRLTLILGLKVLSHLYSLSQRYFLNQKPGALTNVIRRAQRDVPMITLGLFFHALPTLLEFICVMTLIACLYPFSYSLLLGSILLLFFIYTSLSMKTVLKDREQANEVDKEVDGIVTDWLSNHEAIQTFGQKSLAINICERELKNRESAEVKFLKKFSLVRLGQSLILGLGLTSLTFLVGQGVLNQTLTIGDFVLFNGYILQFIVPMSLLGQISQDIKKALLDMKGILGILLTEGDIKEASTPVHLKGGHFSIDFRNVGFTYQERSVLKNVSFSVKSGETVLIVGPTGVGKSTIAKLLLRLYDPTEGQIVINNTNLKEISFDSLYKTIGWVSQETILFNDTIKNNLHFVRPESSLEDIERALFLANLLPFIKKLPEGINTIVGDRGLKLSGGEKQRLSLARLFLKQPKIGIFDEATSFLDRKTELKIQENIKTHFPNMTKIIITHRPFMAETAHKTIHLGQENSLLNFTKKGASAFRIFTSIPNPSLRLRKES